MSGMLGMIYMSGRDFPMSYEEAAKWSRLGAEGGQPEAQQNLGFLYLTGQGVQTNVVYALMWYDVVNKPDRRSGEIHRRLTEALSEDQRSRARELADQCAKARFKACGTGAETELAVPAAPTTSEVALFNAQTVEDYPSISIRLGEQGAVTIKYQVAQNGAVASCAVTRSSGKPRLDDAACTTVQKWVFLPAYEDGKPVEVEKTGNVVFQLK